ncbi:MAG: YggT family protein [Candidatus Dadabacteria bacterium]|jgi:YggT family protein|nr:YggT family protein [Candidatus Dadabacteria bacterium]
MFIVANLVIGIGQALHYILNIYIFIVVGRAIISWVNPDPYNPIVRFLYMATEPVLRYVRRLIPIVSGIDFSPIIVMVALFFLDQVLVQSIIDYGVRMKAGMP